MDPEQKPIVFLAGRIRPESKRFGLVSCGLKEVNDLNTALLRPFCYQGKEYLFSGPYVYGCQQEEEKAMRSQKKQDDLKEDEAQGQVQQYSEGFMQKQRQYTFNRCVHGMQLSTHFFVWVEDEECFGTVWQLGFLYALNKKVYLAHSKNINESGGHLWFSFQKVTAKKQCENIQSALSWFFNEINHRVQ